MGNLNWQNMKEVVENSATVEKEDGIGNGEVSYLIIFFPLYMNCFIQGED